MVVLDEWQVVLLVPAGLDDDVAGRLLGEVGGRLRDWVVAETGRLAEAHEGCSLSIG